MKTAFLWIPLALLAGYYIGGTVPRRELVRVKADLEKARTERPPPAQRAETVAAVERLVNLSPNPTPIAPPAPIPVSAPSTTNAPAVTETPSPPERPRPSPEEFKARIEKAAEAWRMRSDVIRNGFIEKAGLNQEQAAQFDTLTAAMNLRLRHEIEGLAERLKNNTEMTPEEGTRFLNSMSAAIVTTYDDLDRTLPPTWRRDAGSDFDAVDFIDPSVAEPLINVSPQLDQMRSSRMGRNRGRMPMFGP